MPEFIERTNLQLNVCVAARRLQGRLNRFSGDLLTSRGTFLIIKYRSYFR
jgi:hypothetical protein